MEDILGTNAVIAGLLGVLGWVAQILKNYYRGNCDGLSIFVGVMPLYGYSSWLSYGLCLSNPYLCISQSAGVVCMLVILFQFWWYRKPKKMDINDV